METTLSFTPDLVSTEMVRPRILTLVPAVVLLYDHLCSLDKEVANIWKRWPWNRGSILFMLNRYIPYLYITIALEENWLITSSSNACRKRDIAKAVIVTVGNTSSGAILCLRTWALWERRRFVIYILGITVFVTLLLTSLSFALRFIHSQYIPISPGWLSCFTQIHNSFWTTAEFALMLFPESVVTGLTLVKAVKTRHSNSSWVLKVHYTGIIYYIYILVLTIINIIVTVHLTPNVGMQSFSVAQGVLHSVLTNRVVFLARERSELEATTSMLENE